MGESRRKWKNSAVALAAAMMSQPSQARQDRDAHLRRLTELAWGVAAMVGSGDTQFGAICEHVVSGRFTNVRAANQAGPACSRNGNA